MVMVFSMLVSILAYSAVWTPAFAVGLVLLMLIHEFGHVIAMNKEGFKTSAPVFIPFLGAMLFSPKGMDRRQEAVIGIGGVVLGGIFSFILLGVYFIYPSNYILLFAYIGFALNLFQMIPLTPLDGGRVVQAVGKNFQFVGIIFLIALTIMIRQPSILIIWVIVFFDFTFLSFKQRMIGASVVELALIIFTVFKIGIEDDGVLFACIIDSVVGFFYVVLIIANWRMDMAGMERTFNQSDRPQLENGQRIFWMGVFIFTIVILFSAMVYMSPMLKDLKF
jgi:Zn-dependent protease